MNRLARQEIYAGTYHGIERSLRQIDRVTEEHVMEEALHLFEPPALSLVTVGPFCTDFPKKADLAP